MSKLIADALGAVPRRTLEIDPPRWRETIQLSLALWLTAHCVVAAATLFSGLMNSWPQAVTQIIGTIACFGLALPLHGLLRHLDGKPLAYAAALGLAALVVLAALQTAADYGTQYVLCMFEPDFRMSSTSVRGITLIGVLYWLLTSCNAALLLISASARRIRNGEVALARSEVTALQAELKMMRMQLNPHFLANALEAISALVAERRNAEAEAMSQRLATYLHATMQLEEDDIRLEDEFRLLQHYIDMEGMRFGDRLRTTLSVDPELRDFAIPNFLLQPLVENAIRHGVEHAAGQAEVRVDARRDAESLVLVVENGGGRGPVRPVMRHGRTGGIGLANTRTRLRMLFGGEAALITQALHDGYRASIRLPLAMLASQAPA